MASKTETNRPTNSGAEDNVGESGRLSGVRQTAAEAYESARARTRAAVTTTRDTVRDVGQRTIDGLETNPVAAVIGGLAIGAVVAALLPKTRREEELLGSAGRKLNDTAREAIVAAREAGRKELDEIGISRDGVRRRLEEFTDRAVGAVREKGGSDGGGKP